MSPNILSSSLKKAWLVNPLQVPQRGPYGERYPLTGHVSLFISLLETLIREPPPCSLTGSSWTGILRHQSHCSRYSFIHSFIHVCLLESPKRSSPTYGEKHKVNIHRAPCRQKAYIQWGAAWFPKGNENRLHVWCIWYHANVERLPKLFHYMFYLLLICVMAHIFISKN